MALGRTQKYMILAAFGAVVLLIAAWRFLVLFFTFESIPTVSVPRDADQMTAGYGQIASGATQDSVIGIMGSQFTVEKCPPNADPTCAHVWHYESGGQAWDFTFDMDGNLMSKQIATAGE